MARVISGREICLFQFLPVDHLIGPGGRFPAPLAVFPHCPASLVEHPAQSPAGQRITLTSFIFYRGKYFIFYILYSLRMDLSQDRVEVYLNIINDRIQVLLYNYKANAKVVFF